MKNITVLQIGLGPLGRKITQFLDERPQFRINAAVDTDPALVGKTLGELGGTVSSDIRISPSLKDALRGGRPDVVVLTTVSDLVRITPQLEEILVARLPVVSTCEELCYPWVAHPDLAARIDREARRHKVAVLSTGVNPGFLMDSLAICLTAVSQKVEAVRVMRIQNAAFRRLPFQKKIGAGLTLEEFESKRRQGTLRHVGLTESMHMVAARMGWVLERIEEGLTPVVADTRIETEQMTIEAGQASGVQQIGRGFADGMEKITLTFRAAVGEKNPEDTIRIEGNPPITYTCQGGINGDVATCAITLNAIPRLLDSSPGLKTMIDIPVVSWFGALK